MNISKEALAPLIKEIKHTLDSENEELRYEFIVDKNKIIEQAIASLEDMIKKLKSLKSREYAVCSMCGEKKPVIDFYIRNNRSDAVQGRCKSCSLKYKRELAAKRRSEAKQKPDEVSTTPRPVELEKIESVTVSPRGATILDNIPTTSGSVVEQPVTKPVKKCKWCDKINLKTGDYCSYECKSRSRAVKEQRQIDKGIAKINTSVSDALDIEEEPMPVLTPAKPYSEIVKDQKKRLKSGAFDKYETPPPTAKPPGKSVANAKD